MFVPKTLKASRGAFGCNLDELFGFVMWILASPKGSSKYIYIYTYKISLSNLYSISYCKVQRPLEGLILPDYPLPATSMNIMSNPDLSTVVYQLGG